MVYYLLFVAGVLAISIYYLFKLIKLNVPLAEEIERLNSRIWHLELKVPKEEVAFEWGIREEKAFELYKMSACCNPQNAVEALEMVNKFYLDLQSYKEKLNSEANNGSITS
ncbi:MAG: hypothetical protein SFU25_01600 [Candidatus Caenarcaniphilales bacterium]|nr:hypothetical protein [Candidatus Caenarcaniphilales bacterium]